MQVMYSTGEKMEDQIAEEDQDLREAMKVLEKYYEHFIVMKGNCSGCPNCKAE